MNKLHTAVITTCLLALAGCHTLGIEKKRVDYKAASSTRVPSLEVPPDLTTPQAEDRYAIPEGNGESVESYSDYAKGAGNLPQRVAMSNNVLPPVKGAHLEHQGTQYFLVVDGPAQSVWPKVKAFWQQNGFTLKTDNPQAGIMETDWRENRANIPEGGLRKLLGKVFSDVYDSGTRDRYLTRFERSADGKSTNIYITQYGMQEVLTGADKDSSKWEPRAHDPALEATMLQMLMASLGGNGTATPGTAAGQAAAGSVQPMLQRLSDGSTAIVLREPFGRCWQSVEAGLSQAGIAVEDKDRTGGVLYLSPAKKEEGSLLNELEFWKSDDNKPARIQVLVHQDTTGCMVTATTEDGSSNDDTRHVIDALYRAMALQAAPVAVAGHNGGAAPMYRSAPPKLQDSASNKTILLGEPLDLCWNDTLSALDRAKMSPVDTDRPAGKFFLPAVDRDKAGSWFSRLEFWKTGDIKMARPEIVIRSVSGGCEISANDGNGGTNDATQAIIDTLYQNINR